MNPNHTDQSGKLAQAQILQTQIGRPLAILHSYVRFDGVQTTPAVDSILRPIAENGSVPLLDWHCPAQLPTSRSEEKFHRVVASTADALRSYGGPVLLRYGWEMNLPKHCGSDEDPAGYIAMWRSVVATFRSLHVNNVAFVWCPGVSRANWSSFFPGTQWVNWIAADGYDHSRTGTAAFASIFGSFYDVYRNSGRPLMIAETGADNRYDQAGFISGLSAVPEQFPDVKALVYFDAPGPRGDWQIPADTPAMSAFDAVAHEAYFGFMA